MKFIMFLLSHFIFLDIVVLQSIFTIYLAIDGPLIQESNIIITKGWFQQMRIDFLIGFELHYKHFKPFGFYQ